MTYIEVFTNIAMVAAVTGFALLAVFFLIYLLVRFWESRL